MHFIIGARQSGKTHDLVEWARGHYVVMVWRERYAILRRAKCHHNKVRCVHGDEIVACGWRRICCLECGRYLKGPLPVWCYYTDEPHTSYGLDIPSAR